MRTVKAFALGTIATGVLAYAAMAALAVAAQESGRALRVAIGPAVFVAVDRDRDATAITLGAGLLVLALAGGLLNAGVALLLARRSRRTLRID